MGRNLIIALVRAVFEREKNPIKDKCPGLLFGSI